MRCITMLRSGGNRVDSVYLIHYKPTEKQYKEFRRHVSDTNTRIIPSRYQMLLQEIANLKEANKNLTKDYADLDSRITNLEVLITGQPRSK